MNRQEILDTVAAWKHMDVTTTPTFITHAALYEAFKKKGMSNYSAGKLAGCVEVEVTQGFVDDKELFDIVIEGYADLLYKVYMAMTAVNTDMFWTRMEKQGLKLSYTNE